MKLLKHIIRAGALCGLLLTTAAAEAQTVQLKVMEWNVLSFEMTDKSNQIDFIVDEYVDLIKAQNPDIVCINELETGTSRMGKEKLTELASRLGMYPYFIMSYPKDVGFYGNGTSRNTRSSTRSLRSSPTDMPTARATTSGTRARTTTATATTSAA